MRRSVAQGRLLRRAEPGDAAIDWIATLGDADNHRRHPADRHTKGRLALSRLHRLQRRSNAAETWLLLLDTSGSLLARGAMAKAKGAVAELCQQAYLRRLSLELLGFGRDEVVTAQTVRRPPRDITPLLDAIDSGGGTPLRRALLHLDCRLTQLSRQYPDQWQRVFIFTDARSRDSLDGIAWAAHTQVIDTEQGAVRLGRARTLAAHLNAQYAHIDNLPLR